MMFFMINANLSHPYSAEFERSGVPFSELSRKMAYTIRNTVNRLTRNELNLNPVVLERSKEK